MTLTLNRSQSPSRAHLANIQATMRQSRPPPRLKLHIYMNLTDGRIWSHVVVSGATSSDPGWGGVAPTDDEKSEENNICLWAAGCHACLVPTKDLSWHCILHQHACNPLDILVNTPNSRRAAIIISRAWDYPGARYPPGLQALKARSDFWMNHLAQASDLWYVF